MRRLYFDACELMVFEDHVRTRFHADGAESIMYPPRDGTYAAIAQACGYGDPLRYGIEHEIIHALLADVEGKRHSWSVWSAAHGTAGTASDTAEWSQRVKDEEHMVNSFQRYLNTGELDQYDLLRKKLGDRRLPRLAHRALLLCRPWLEAPIK